MDPPSEKGNDTTNQDDSQANEQEVEEVRPTRPRDPITELQEEGKRSPTMGHVVSDNDSQQVEENPMTRLKNRGLDAEGNEFSLLQKEQQRLREEEQRLREEEQRLREEEAATEGKIIWQQQRQRREREMIEGRVVTKRQRRQRNWNDETGEAEDFYGNPMLSQMNKGRPDSSLILSDDSSDKESDHLFDQPPLNVQNRPIGMAPRQRLRPHIIQLARGDDNHDGDDSDDEDLRILRGDNRRRPNRFHPVRNRPAAIPNPANNHNRNNQLPRFVLDLPNWIKPSSTRQWKTILFSLTITACVSIAIFAVFLSNSLDSSTSTEHHQSSSASINEKVPSTDIQGDIVDNPSIERPTNVIPALIDSFYSNTNEPFDPLTQIPVLFQIRKSVDSTMLMEHLGKCAGFLQASNVGRNYVSASLEILHTRYGDYVNVDLSKLEGIQHAHDSYLLYQPPSKLHVNSLASPFIYEIGDKLLDRSLNRGRLFMMFPDPEEYIYSIYNYLVSGAWMSKLKAVTNPNPYAEMSFQDYVKEVNRPEFNIIARTLAGKETDSAIMPQLSFADLEVAKQILRQKVLIGLTADRATSLNRFQSFFGYEFVEPISQECRIAPLHWPPPSSSTSVFSKEEMSEALRTCCQLDMALYEYAKQLFIDQEILFPIQF
jgi:hypothetical protein